MRQMEDSGNKELPAAAGRQARRKQIYPVPVLYCYLTGGFLTDKIYSEDGWQYEKEEKKSVFSDAKKSGACGSSSVCGGFFDGWLQNSEADESRV